MWTHHLPARRVADAVRWADSRGGLFLLVCLAGCARALPTVADLADVPAIVADVVDAQPSDTKTPDVALMDSADIQLADAVADIAAPGPEVAGVDAAADAAPEVADTVSAAEEAASSCPDMAPCDDGNTCTQQDHCTGGVCAGTPYLCPAPTKCQIYSSCDGKGGCEAPLKSDGEVCDGPDCGAGSGKVAATCKGGICIAAKWESCDDGDACTVDGCTLTSGCTHTPKPGGCANSKEILIPAGAFKMGCAANDPYCGEDEKPQHEVTLDAYFIDTFEVTVAEYKNCVNAGVCKTPGTGQTHCNWNKPGKDNHPINCVDWTQADAYCTWIGAYLPSEAQWEKAARGGVQDTIYPWGDQQPTCVLGEPNTAVFDPITNATLQTGCGQFATWEVGTGSTQNGAGLFDVIGNVWEWVADAYDANYYATSPAANPKGPTGTASRSVRGGSFLNSAGGIFVMRTSNRVQVSPTQQDHGVGFRCARTP